MKKFLLACMIFIISVIFLACTENPKSDIVETGATTTTIPITQMESSYSTTGPSMNLGEKSVAVNDGPSIEYDISNKKAWIIDVTNYNAERQDQWTVEIPISNDFDLNRVEYIGCCNCYLESVDLPITCKVIETSLVISGQWELEENDLGTTPLYVVVVIDLNKTEVKLAYSGVSYTSYFGDVVLKSEKRQIKRLTGLKKYQEPNGKFSEGVCWGEVLYADTIVTAPALFDKDGKLLFELRNYKYKTYGDYYNGVALVEDEQGVSLFIDTKGEIVFSSDNEKYKEQISGMFPGGYIFLERTEANMTSKTSYYAIIDCNENFVINWTEYEDYALFNYLGDGIFVFLDRLDEDAMVKFYNAKADIWTMVEANGLSLQGLPNLVAQDTDGIVVFDNVLVFTKKGKSHVLEEGYKYGKIEQGKLPILKVDTHYKEITEYGCVSLNELKYEIFEYEHLALAQPPERIKEFRIPENLVKMGIFPAYNMTDSYKITINTIQFPMSTDVYDIQFSNGVAMLQLRGVDGFDYYTLVNTKGENAIEPVRGKAIATLGNGRFLVERDGVKSIINEKGEEIKLFSGEASCSIYNVSEYCEGVAWATISCGSCYIDINGNYIFGRDDVADEIQTIALKGVSVRSIVSE